METFASFDGEPIAYRTLGDGSPVILIHGLFSSAETNWVRYGHAAAVAEAGFRVVLPDLRAHGASAKPREAAGWPPGALARDILALVRHLGLEDGGYDLGGYSLGARVTVAALAAGASPRRVVLAGMGLEGLTGASGRAGLFTAAIDNRDCNPPGSFAAYAVQFARSNKVDLDSARFLLQDFRAYTPGELAAACPMPVTVIAGRDDRDNGSAAELAAALTDSRFVELLGDHVTSVTKPGLGAAIAEALS